MRETPVLRLERRRVSTAAVSLGVLTICLRLPAALSSSFWQDEVASARVIQQPTFGAMLHQVVRTESTPPLWYALAWVGHRAGISIHDIRLLSVIFDGAIVAAIVTLGGMVFGLGLAVAAGSIAAITAQLSAHGRELRAYELLALVALSLAVSLDQARRRPDARLLALVAGSVTAGLLTHYFFAFTVAAAVLWIMFEPNTAQVRRQLLTAIAIGCSLAAPWAPWFLSQYRADRYSWIGAFSATNVVSTPLRILQPLLDSQPTRWLLLVWLAVATYHAMRIGSRARLIATLALMPILLAAITWALGLRVYAVRNLIATAPFTIVLLLIPLTHFRRRATTLLATSALVTAFVAAYAVDQLRPDAPYAALAAALVVDGWHQSSPVAVVGGPHALTSPLEWYLPGTPTFVSRLPPSRSESQVFAVIDAASPARGAVHDAIEVEGWLVGKLSVHRLRNPRMRLTLLTPISSPERTLALH
jgi:hypothetical protein